MNRFLLLALTAGLLSPIAANAESVWLVLHANDADTETFEKVEMKDMTQCLEQGKIYRTTRRINGDESSQGIKTLHRSFICLEGK